MKCPKCGSSRAKYVEDRKKFHSKKKGLECPTPRTNFDAVCPDCGFKFNTKEIEGWNREKAKVSPSLNCVVKNISLMTKGFAIVLKLINCVIEWIVQSLENPKGWFKTNQDERRALKILQERGNVIDENEFREWCEKREDKDRFGKGKIAYDWEREHPWTIRNCLKFREEEEGDDWNESNAKNLEGVCSSDFYTHLANRMGSQLHKWLRWISIILFVIIFPLKQMNGKQ